MVLCANWLKSQYVSATNWVCITVAVCISIPNAITNYILLCFLNSNKFMWLKEILLWLRPHWIFTMR